MLVRKVGKEVTKKSRTIIIKYCFYCLAASLYCVLISLACKNVGLDSDKANHLLQAKDIVEGNVFLKDWFLTGVTFLTTDLPYYILGYLLCGVSFRGVYVSAGLMIAAALIAGYVCSFVCTDRNKEKKIMYLLLVGIPSINLVYHFRVHTGAVTVILLCFLLFHCLINDVISEKHIWLLGFLMFVGVFGDLLVAIECCLPIVLYSLYFIAITDKEHHAKLIKHILISVLSAAFAIVAQKLYIIIGGSNLNSYLMSRSYFTDISLWPDKINEFIHSVLLIAGADFTGHPINDIAYTVRVCNFIVLVIAIIIAAVLIVKMFRKEKIDCLSFVMILAIFFSASAYIFTDLAEPRYITVIPLCIFIVFIRNIEFVFAYFSNKRLVSSVLLLSAAVSAVSNCSGYITRNYDDYYKVQNYSQYPLDSYYDLIAFLKDHNLKNGYASFWNSSIITVLSGEEVTIRHIDRLDNMFIVNRWFCKSNWYQEETDFLLINTNDEGDNTFNNGVDSAIQFFGEPIEQYVLNGYIILVYDYDLSTALGKNQSALSDGIIEVSELFSYESDSADNYIVIHNDGGVYGPYGTIDAGTYTVIYEGEKLDNVVIDVHSRNYDCFEYEIVNINSNEVTLTLSVFSQIDDIEFRVTNSGSSDAILKRIVIQ